jgi:endo-1,4-beta-xylanase
MSNLTLAKAYEKYFKIGAATSPHELPAHGNLIKTQFSSISPENQMKYGPIHPSKDEWNFAPADELVNFAQDNGLVFRAHAPVWHGGTAPWIFKNADDTDVSREELLERLEQHIAAFCARYGDKVQYWDVVNEAVNDNLDKAPLRETRWMNIIGPDYLPIAFKLAKKYAPNVQLFYNDYNECVPEKRERICNLIKMVQDAGAPIDGFGMQMHINIHDADVDEVKRSIEMYAALGVRLHVTEMDISMYKHEDTRMPPAPLTDEFFAKQGQLYVDLFRVFREYSDVMDNVTTWGAADDYTWLSGFPVQGRPNYPLMFYSDHAMKPFVYRMIDEAVAGK